MNAAANHGCKRRYMAVPGLGRPRAPVWKLLATVAVVLASLAVIAWMLVVGPPELASPLERQLRA